ncbi:MAG: hypothetical protein RL617_306 [Pseudomonadota bacterium]
MSAGSAKNPPAIESHTVARKLNLSKQRATPSHSKKGRSTEEGGNDSPSFTGRLIGHRDGFGFIRPDTGGDDVFVSPREMLKAMHGDRVRAQVIGTDRRGRPEATIQEVVEHDTRNIVGRLVQERGILLVAPEDQRIKHDVLIGASDTGGAEPGQVVMVEIIEPPTRYTPPVGRVVERLGSIDDPGMEVEIAVRKFDVPHRFSSAAERLAERLPKAVRTADVKDRIDLRDLPLMTIDGEDARDFDDAVYAEVIPKKGWRLIVAIADVSHYVKPDDALDRDAFERATSVYFPRRVIPMLPEALSNGLCSLNPGVERLALVCDMVVSETGMVRAYQFYDAVILSAARLTYDQAWAALADPTGPEARVLGPRLRALETLYEVYKAFAAQRQSRGAIELETVETYMKTDDHGRIQQIMPRMRNDAHRLIEECMLAANTSAADFLERQKRTGLFRVHEGPTPERLRSLREFLKTQGLRLAGGDAPQPSDYARLSREIKLRPDARLLQTLLLRSMQQAIYTPDNSGHFGLAYPAYAHFTSPIRRYPDLLVHRVIKAALGGANYVPKYGQRSDEPSKRSDATERWRIIGDHCSAAERRADEASRDVEAWLKCQFMKNRVGEQLPGTVTGVTSFGLFVTLDSLFVEGLIHVSELGGEYFQFNETIHELRGERTGRRFRLYDPLIVQVSRVDLEARRIEFRLVPSMIRAVKKDKTVVDSEEASFQAFDNDGLYDEIMPSRGRKSSALPAPEAGRKKKSVSKASKSKRVPGRIAPSKRSASRKSRRG